MARSKWVMAGKAIFPMTIAVEVDKLSKPHESRFKQVHTEGGCMGRIGRKSICKACKKEVTPDAIGTAYALGALKEGKDGKGADDVLCSKDERKSMLPAIPPETYEVLSFIPAPPLKFYTGIHRVVTALEDKAMYVVALATLLEGMKDAGLVALMQYADNGTTYLATLENSNGVAVAHELFFADEVGNEQENASAQLISAAASKFTAPLKAMAKKLVTANADKKGDILYTLVDTFTAKIEALVQEKKANGIMTLPTAIPQPVVDPTADIMAQMMANLAAADAATAPAPVAEKKSRKKEKVAA